MNPIMKFICQFCLLVVLMLSSLSLVAQEAIDPGQAYFNQGHFEKAVEYWDKALSNLLSPHEKDIKSCIDTKKCIDTSVRLAAAYQALGQVKRALKVLESACLLTKDDDPERKASVLMQLSDVYVAARDFQEGNMDCSMKEKIRPNPLTRQGIMDKALNYLEQAEQALAKIDREKYPLLWANILHKKINIRLLKIFKYQQWKKFKEIVNEKQKIDHDYNNFNKSIELAKNILARKVEVQVLNVKTSINLIQGRTQIGEFDKIKSELESSSIFLQVKDLPDSHDKAFAFISLAKLMLTFKPSSKHEEKRKLSPRERYVYYALTEALHVAKKQGNSRVIAYAKFYLAQLYKEKGRYDDAILLTKQGIRHAQSHIFFSSSKQGDKMISYGGDSFVSDRFKVYLPSLADETSLFGWDTISEKDCRKMCQEQDALPASLQYIFSENCKGICQDMSPLSTQNYYPELLFSLERQLGEYLEIQGKREGAIEAYRRAVKHLQFRQETRSLSQSFRDMEEKAYFELADLLLQQATKAPASKKQALLRDAIDNIESFKTAELRNYFQDECITEGLQDTIHLDNLPNNVAVFYPLLFDDRIELLVISNNGIQQRHPFPKDNISVGELKNKVNYFLEEDLIGHSSDDFDPKKNAQDIYDGLIKPIINVLAQKVDTLIVVPDATLRTIPFAALHDGKEFLVEKDFSLVVTPSIKLTVYGKMQRDNVWALLNGSKTFQKGAPLECVPLELHKVSCLLKDNTFIKEEEFAFKDTSTCALKDSSTCALLESKISLLLNEDFTLDNVKKKLNNTPYSIVHFATHGFFYSDPNYTFLQTYDGRIRMSELKTLIRDVEKKFKYQPIELLTLSACQTAIGDKRATLGLAGAAIQTGVSSVLATLWNVADPATTQLISEFYRQLREKPDSSKAKALQEAQKQLLNRVGIRKEKNKEGKEDKNVEYRSYKHPYYWAPFLLIGNWL